MTTECSCPKDLKNLVMIEYPGFVKNTVKALNTMGGLESIEKVVESQKDRLELKFRKLDPLAHPAHGDRVPKKCLVLRIHKSKSEPNEESTSSNKGDFTLSVIGKIQTSFVFETLAEFQWLPMQRINLAENSKSDKKFSEGVRIQRTTESLDPKYTSILDDILPIKNPFDNTLKNFNPDAPLLILPTVFSRFDTPREIHQPHPKFRSKEMRDEFERQQSLAIIGRTRKKRSTMSYLMSFGQQAPDKPSEKLIKDKAMLSSQENTLVPRLENCFERQKVWSKAALCYELNCSAIDIKYVLPLVAYYYSTGPFRTMWVRYGYDPHKDNSSKVLQTLDFRVKNPCDQQEYSKRSIHQYQLPLRKNVEKLRSNPQLDLKSMMLAQGSNNPVWKNHGNHRQQYYDLDDSLIGIRGMPITEAMCKFRKDLIPPARQLSYHLKDIEIDEVQALVHSNDGREPEECSEKDGWLPEGTIDKIRKIMTKSLNGTVDLMTSQLEEG